MLLRAENVFKLGAYPEYTYVSRNYEHTDVSYELRLKQGLRTAGCLTSLIGPSKMGKTILCEKVIGFENIIEVSGADFNETSDFWSIIAAKVGLPYQGDVTIGKESKEQDYKESDSRTERYILSKDKIIEYYKEKGKVLVIDDFHYATDKMQLKMAQQLKDAIRRELKVVVVSLPHRSDDAIRQNSDLLGRLRLINIEAWAREDLKKIALRGFEKLEKEIQDSTAEKIAAESLTSPQLMQDICLSICTMMEEKGKERVEDEILESAYRFTTMNFDYRDVVHIMSKGSNTRGKSRKLYQTIFNKKLDLYGLLVETLAKNPPVMELDVEMIYNRIEKLIVEQGTCPTKQAIREHLGKLQTVLGERENIYKVLEWKDGKVYILDPLFLFYLRWGRKDGE